jgi:hypothetical protein
MKLIDLELEEEEEDDDDDDDDDEPSLARGSLVSCLGRVR